MSEVGDSVDVSMDGLRVMIGMPVNRDIPPRTVQSLLATVTHCVRLGVHLEIQMITGCAIITKARDEVVKQFLDGDCTHLFWIDSDMTWKSEQFIRLLALGTKVEIVGAAYPSKREPPTFMINFEKSGMLRGEYGLLEVKGLGLGFTIMQRKVIQAISDMSTPMYDEALQREMKSVFRVDIIDGKFRGEDMAFFADLKELGYKICMDASIDLGHIGQKEYTGSIMDGLEYKD